MKLSTKISFSMGALTVLIAILAVYLLVQMKSVNEMSTTLAGRNIPVIDLAGKLNNDPEYRIAETRYVLNPTRPTGSGMKKRWRTGRRKLIPISPN